MRRIWVDQDRCLGCKTCELACAIKRGSLSQTLIGAANEEIKPKARVKVSGNNDKSFALQCRHCQAAPCLAVCPSGALQREEKDQLISLDQDKCRGCWMCVMTCPFGAISASSEYQVAMKCDACLHMDEPACVASCPTGALQNCNEEDFAEILRIKRNNVATLFVNDKTGACCPDYKCEEN